MKKFLLISLFSSFLFSCSQSNSSVDNLALDESNSTIQSKEAEKNFFESFEYFYGAPDTYGLDSSGLSEVLLKVKSLTGGTKYDMVTANSTLRYTFYNDESSDEYKLGKIRLAKDNKLYLEAHTIDYKTNEYYELGSFDKSSLVTKNGSALKVKMNSNIKFKFEGQGLNPMAKSKFIIKTSSIIKPVKKLATDFL